MRVHAEGARERTPCFDVRTAPTPCVHARVAVVVPRFSETAVSRNRVKRRLRELVRRELLPDLAPQDLVVRATPASYRATFDALRVAMRDVARRLGDPR
jgi:ribonuclease P protein component